MKSINITDSVLFLTCLIAFFGGVIYKLYALNWLGVIISLILAVICFYYWQKIDISEPTPPPSNSAGRREGTFCFSNSILIISYLAVIIILFFALLKNATTAAIISPWQVIPGYFFFFYAVATGLLFLLARKIGRFAIHLLCLHYFLSFAVALVIYKIGYGFDPFIHRATAELIDKTGAVDPKPFYYLGQYGLVVILHKIIFLPVVWLDKLLVPVLAAVFLPVYLWRFFKKWAGGGNDAAAMVLLALALPFSLFIVTTPQNLAYSFLLLAVLVGANIKERRDLILIYALAAAALVTQPIAGIPAMLFAAALHVNRVYAAKPRRAMNAAIFILAAVGLPLAFLAVERGFSGAGWQWQNLAAISWPRFNMPAQDNFLLNSVYLYAFNFKFIFFAAAVAGGWLMYRHYDKCRPIKGAQLLLSCLLLAAGMVCAYFLSRLFSFDYLIEYERTDFPGRLLAVAAIFVLPFVLVALRGFYGKLARQARSIIVSFAIFAVLLITASLYISYPRFDDYLNSRGYSVSAADIETVRLIEKNSRGDYIVLANQQVSAAALREFGFKKYYTARNVTPPQPSPYQGEGEQRTPPPRQGGGRGEVFYYPIPTGGPLYQYYLDMVYGGPGRATVEAAMDLAGVNEAYFVLNKYWWASPKILEEAKLEADLWQSVDNGEVYVFRYERN